MQAIHSIPGLTYTERHALATLWLYGAQAGVQIGPTLLANLMGAPYRTDTVRKALFKLTKKKLLVTTRGGRYPTRRISPRLILPEARATKIKKSRDERSRTNRAAEDPVEVSRNGARQAPVDESVNVAPQYPIEVAQQGADLPLQQGADLPTDILPYGEKGRHPAPSPLNAAVAGPDATESEPHTSAPLKPAWAAIQNARRLQTEGAA